MPPIGRRRNLSLFLLRLVFLYFFAWAPFLFLALIGDFIQLDAWVMWAGALVSHLQGLICAGFCLTNQDVLEAFLAVISCERPPTGGEQHMILESTEGMQESSQRRKSFSAYLMRMVKSGDPLRQSTLNPSGGSCISDNIEKPLGEGAEGPKDEPPVHSAEATELLEGHHPRSQQSDDREDFAKDDERIAPTTGD